MVAWKKEVKLVVKVNVFDKVVEVRGVCDRVVTAVVFEVDGLRLICGYGSQS